MNAVDLQDATAWYWAICRPWGRRWSFQSQADAPNLDNAHQSVLNLPAAGSAELEEESGADLQGSSLSSSAMIELGTMTWRLERRIQDLDAERLMRGLPEEFESEAGKVIKRLNRQKSKLSDSLRTLQRLVQEFDLEVVDPTGTPFRTGVISVEVVGWEDVDGERLHPGEYVKDVVSPIVSYKGKLLSRGKVICATEG